tara:strand:+ start:1325 stop:2302 length:978 start_codon:yes stop_codon:yes gene_type:complete
MKQIKDIFLPKSVGKENNNSSGANSFVSLRDWIVSNNNINTFEEIKALYNLSFGEDGIIAPNGFAVSLLEKKNYGASGTTFSKTINIDGPLGGEEGGEEALPPAVIPNNFSKEIVTFNGVMDTKSTDALNPITSVNYSFAQLRNNLLPGQPIIYQELLIDSETAYTVYKYNTLIDDPTTPHSVMITSKTDSRADAVNITISDQGIVTDLNDIGGGDFGPGGDPGGGFGGGFGGGGAANPTYSVYINQSQPFGVGTVLMLPFMDAGTSGYVIGDSLSIIFEGSPAGTLDVTVTNVNMWMNTLSVQIVSEPPPAAVGGGNTWQVTKN